ncbi:hypothetical protein NN561_000041 [Cricetulus griseus]
MQVQSRGCRERAARVGRRRRAEAAGSARPGGSGRAPRPALRSLQQLYGGIGLSCWFLRPFSPTCPTADSIYCACRAEGTGRKVWRVVEAGVPSSPLHLNVACVPVKLQQTLVTRSSQNVLRGSVAVLRVAVQGPAIRSCREALGVCAGQGLCVVSCGTEDGDMRLVNGASASEGRVEIFYRGQWGTVCDNLWNILDANVVCRALGYENATRALGRAAFGPGQGPVMLDEVECAGTEPSLANCSSLGWLKSRCGHEKDAGVVCSNGELPLPSQHLEEVWWAHALPLPAPMCKQKLRVALWVWLGCMKAHFLQEGPLRYPCQSSCAVEQWIMETESMHILDLSGDLPDALGQIFDSQQGCDLFIQVTGQGHRDLTLCAHKLILNTNSEAQALWHAEGSSVIMRVDVDCMPVVRDFLR